METNIQTVADNSCANPEDTLLKRVQNRIDKFFAFIVGVALIAELIIMFGNVVSRFFFESSIRGSEELGELALIIIAFIGGAIAYPREQHVAVKVIFRFLPSRWHETIRAVALWMIVGISFIAAILSIQIVFITKLKNLNPIFKIRKAW